MNDQGGSCLSESVASICREPVRAIPWQSTLLLPLAAGLLLFWGLGRRSLWAAEGRWAEVTREMLLTGDYFHPTIGGEPYFDKPLLTYWLRAALAGLTGTLNELIVRLPSAFAGLAALWATVRIGTRLWSAQTGRIAGGLLLTTYAFLFWARTGTADAENLAAITLAVAWYWSRRDRLSFSALLIFYLIAFLGALTKGLTAVVVPVLVVLPDMLVEKRWRILLSVRHSVAFAIAAFVYLSPFIDAALTRPAEYGSGGLTLVFQENILRYFRPLDHKGPIYLYLYELPVLLLPWTPLFVLAFLGAVRTRRHLDRHTRWLVWAILLVFAFFSLSGSRRSYYILPILPLCALLMAVFVVWMRAPGVEELRRKGLAAQRILFIGLIVFNLAIPPVLIIAGRAWHFHVPLAFHVASLVIGTAAALVYSVLARTTWLGSSSPECGVVGPWIGVAALLLAGYFGWQQTILEANRTMRPFAGQVQAGTAGIPPQQIGIFPKCHATILFYLDRSGPVEVLRNADEIRCFMDRPQPAALITQQRYAVGLPPDISARLLQGQSLREPVRPWESKSSRPEKWMAWVWGIPGKAGDAVKNRKMADDAK